VEGDMETGDRFAHIL